MKTVTIELHEDDAMEASKALVIKALDWRNSSSIWNPEQKLRMRQTADTLERVAALLKEACYKRRRHDQAINGRTERPRRRP